ncbi:hypothetical protein [Agrobacterium vitis]|uniref:hypothetical protein n=1 Tax=Agrobacterium vitis TaxID=373 RepID=UPI00114CA259|nr:hypothetical protein [Agrobacterium vitis]MUO70065.1 hypothetical protein [Agrobacterium vitis]
MAPNFPELLSEDEKKSMLREAEILWKDLEENKLGGFSCQNRPFYIVHAFKCAIEKYGHRDVGLNWSKDALDAARSAITTAPAQEPFRGSLMDRVMEGLTEVSSFLAGQHKKDFGSKHLQSVKRAEIEIERLRAALSDQPQAVKALADACLLMADDYQTSDSHHPNHVLVPLPAFEAMRSALTTAPAPAQEQTVDDSSRSEGEYSNVYDAVQEQTLVFRKIQARGQEIKPNMYDSSIHFLRIDPPDQQARTAEQERLRFEGDLDKWMKIISAGITGYQPEACAVMDMACQELVRSRTRIAELEAALKPFAAKADRYNDIPGVVRTGDGVELWQISRNAGMDIDITVGDLREARAVLNKGKAGQ